MKPPNRPMMSQVLRCGAEPAGEGGAGVSGASFPNSTALSRTGTGVSLGPGRPGVRGPRGAVVAAVEVGTTACGAEPVRSELDGLPSPGGNGRHIRPIVRDVEMDCRIVLARLLSMA